MKKFVRNCGMSVIAVAAIACLSVLGSAGAFARQEENPRVKPWLGVVIRDVTETVAKEYKLADASGAYVTSVTEDSPADSSGIEEKDVIVQFGQKQIDDAEDLIKAVQKSKVSDKINIVVVRKGEKKTVQVILSKYPRARRIAYSFGETGGPLWFFGNKMTQGMQLMELNEQLGEYFGAPNGSGVLVQQVKKRSAAEKAGIKAGDVLLKIGKRSIDDMEDVSKALSKVDEGGKLDVEVLRKGTNKILSLEVQDDEDSPKLEIFRRRGPDGERQHFPRFDGNMLQFPGWDSQDFRMEPRDFGSDIDVLKRNVDEMTKRLREHQNELRQTIRHLTIRSV